MIPYDRSLLFRFQHYKGNPEVSRCCATRTGRGT